MGSKPNAWIVSGALVLAAAAPSRAGAQSVFETIYTDLSHGVGDVFAVWTSPFRGDGRDYRTAAMVLGGVGVLALYDDEIGAWIRGNPEVAPMVALEPFREEHRLRLIDLGAGKSLLQLSGGLYLLGLVTGNASIRDAAVGCTASEKSNGLLRHYLYKAVSRERPLVLERNGEETIERPGDPYDIRMPGDDEDWYDNSFFGGHGANIMACASFFNHRFDLGLAEPVIWAVATGVNLGRMADQRHWSSDAAIGIIVGFAMGKYVAERSQARADARAVDANGEADGRRGAGEAREPSALDALLRGLFVTRARDGGAVVGWRGRF